VSRLTAHFTQVDAGQTRTLTGTHWYSPAQVGQGKGGLSIATIGSAQQRKESSILGNAQDLPLAEGPAARRKIPREQNDLGYKRF
jgi:hypothetical protein